MSKIKCWLLRLSVALNLLVFLTIAVFILWGGELIMKRVMEPTHKRWVSQFEALKIRENSVVFLGDSITEGGIWEELFPELPVHNRGIGGDVTGGVLARLHQVTAGKPAKVFLLIGTNDISIGLEIEAIADNIEKIVDTIRRDSPQTQIYIQSVLPRAASYRERIERLNQLLQSTIKNKANWINLYPLFLDEADGSIRNDLSNDELHLLGKGYLLWRDELRKWLSLNG